MKKIINFIKNIKIKKKLKKKKNLQSYKLLHALVWLQACASRPPHTLQEKSMIFIEQELQILYLERIWKIACILGP
jgi:hypothetical protein